MDVVFPSASRWAVSGLVVMGQLAVVPLAQAAWPDPLGWSKSSPGSTLQGSQARVSGNRAQGEVTSVGGSGGALGNAAAQANAPGRAQLHAVQLRAVQASGGSFGVLENLSRGAMRALGGSALANSIDADGGAGRTTLSGNRLLVAGNRAGEVQATGGSGRIALGAAALDLSGQAMANTVQLTESPARDSRVLLTSNVADRVHTFGASSLANSVSLARTTLAGSQINQHGNRAEAVQSGGGSGSVGYGAIASAKLSGMAAANTLLASQAELRDAQIMQHANWARNVQALGGAAAANSLWLDNATVRGGSTLLAGNEAAVRSSCWG